MDAVASAAQDPAASYVSCPMCLSRLAWGELSLWRWDGGEGKYLQLELPADASLEQVIRERRMASVRCPDPGQTMGEHYLPADYGYYGAPVVLGFIGTTRSGKSHLLTAMVGAIERGDLADYGVRRRPVDHAMHQKFLDERVRPLLNDARVLAPTQEGVVNFVDAFIIGQPDGPQRPVALFDVAGGELTSVHGAKQFLEVADGLIFVVDPTQFDTGRLGDETFNTVLDLLQSSGRLPSRVSAAVVLNKADLVRFEDPITRWLRYETREIDPDLILRESADVYAYLHRHGAQAWTRPYRECARATMHVASATGGAGPQGGAGGVYPRGVTPRRVLAPLIALLAMTGVLTGQQAQQVGI
jgi:hypothetical protein